MFDSVKQKLRFKDDSCSGHFTSGERKKVTFAEPLERPGRLRSPDVPDVRSHQAKFVKKPNNTACSVSGGACVPELCVSVLLTLANNFQLSVAAEIDTGASSVFLLYNDVKIDKMVRSLSSSASEIVVLADGSQKSINSIFDADLKVFDAYGLDAFSTKVCLKAVFCPAMKAGESKVILGRQFIENERIQCFGAEKVIGHGKTIFDSGLVRPPEKVEQMDCLKILASACEQSSFFYAAGSNDSGLVQLKPIGKDSIVLVNVDSSLSAKIDSICSDLIKKDWSPIRAAPKLEFRLRPLMENEISDVPDLQKYTFEVKIPEISTENRKTRDFSKALYNKLTPAVQKEFDHLVEEYVSQKWWDPADKVSNDTLISVFLIDGKPRSF